MRHRERGERGRQQARPHPTQPRGGEHGEHEESRGAEHVTHGRQADQHSEQDATGCECVAHRSLHDLLLGEDYEREEYTAAGGVMCAFAMRCNQMAYATNAAPAASSAASMSPAAFPNTILWAACD